jgi:aryl-alcohol dehydrogenase-like predicted oxidoreductase
LREHGIAILITDHQVRETLQITDRSYVIRSGKVLCHGRPHEVLANPEARKYYFGEDMDIGKKGPAAPQHIGPVPIRRGQEVQRHPRSNIRLGLGLIGIGKAWGYAESQVPNESDSFLFLKRAYELGITLFDTASSYGLSEERLGKFLRTLSIEQRSRITISTKFGEHWDHRTQTPFVNHSFEALKASLDRSLAILRKIDILQLHKSNPDVLKSDDLKRILDYARSKGVMVFGASVSDTLTGRMACESGMFAVIQCPYNLESKNFSELIDLAKQNRKTILTNRPLGMGKYLYAEANEAPDKKNRLIQSYAFILRKNFQGYVLTGTKSPEHLRENIDAFRIAEQSVFG